LFIEEEREFLELDEVAVAFLFFDFDVLREAREG